jgi:hypothetical protein
MSTAETNAKTQISTAVDLVPVSTLESLARAEIDMQIVTAKRFPRSIAQFRKEALELACIDEETAASCRYVIQRAGKMIEGPGIRLAEIVAFAWKNLRYGARVISDNGRIITAQGFALDLENNNASTIEAGRRCIDKHGRRYSDDMIVVTGNAVCSIALRNALFRVIPLSFVRPIYLAAIKVAVGDATTLNARRAEMMEYFAKLNVSPERIYQMLQVNGLADIGLDQLALLRGVATAIKDNETTIEQAFPEPAAPVKAASNGGKSKADTLGERLSGRRDAGKEPAPGASESAPAADGVNLPSDAPAATPDQIAAESELHQAIEQSKSADDIQYAWEQVIANKEKLTADDYENLIRLCEEKLEGQRKPKAKKAK